MFKKSHIKLAVITAVSATAISLLTGSAYASVDSSPVSQKSFMDHESVNIPKDVEATEIAMHKFRYLDNGVCFTESWFTPREFASIADFKVSNYGGIDRSNAKPEGEPIATEADSCGYGTLTRDATYKTVTNNWLLTTAAELEM